MAPRFEVRLAAVQRGLGGLKTALGARAAADHHAEAAKFTGQAESSRLGGLSSSRSPFGAAPPPFGAFLIIHL